MLNKRSVVSFLLLPILILAACSSQPAATNAVSGQQSTQQPGQTQGQAGQAPDLSNQPIEQKLALGSLKLEGTANAITAEQAKELLPLWKAVKTMASESSTSTDEMDAVYTQIQEAMTAEQVQAIKDLQISQSEIQTLMTQYGIDLSKMRPGGEMRGTPPANSGNSGSSGSNNQPGGDMPAGGMPGGDMPGGGPDGGMPGGDMGGGMPGQQNAQGTPMAQGTRPAGRGGPGGGMNNMFIEPLITLLQARAGIQVTPTAQ